MTNAPAVLREQLAQVDLMAWVGSLCDRYHRLSARGSARSEAALRLAHLGGKLCELQALARERALNSRDAAQLPRLACWVAAQLEELEAAPLVRPLSLPIAPAPDPRRAAALARAILAYGLYFDGAPSTITVRRLDALLARYPLATLTEALAQCALRHGEFHWQGFEESLAGALSVPAQLS